MTLQQLEPVSRIAERINAGVSGLDDLSPQRIFGLSDQDVSVLSHPDSARYPAPAGAYFQARQGLGLRYVHHQRAIACAPAATGLGAIAEYADRLARERGICLLIESSPHPAARAMMASAPPGWVRICAKSGLDEDSAQIPGAPNRSRFPADPARNEEPASGFRALSVDGQVIAWIADDLTSVRLMFNPLGTRSGLSAAQLDGNRGAAMAYLLDVVLEALEGAWREDRADLDRLTASRVGVDLLEAVRAISAAESADMGQMLRDAEEAAGRSARQAENSRDALVRSLRTVTTLNQTLLETRAGDDGSYARAVVSAVAEVERIKAMRPVRDCRVVERNRQFWLDVFLYPYSMQPSNRGPRRLFDKLDFRIRLSSPGRGEIVWVRCVNESRSPHVHVSSNGSTCLGDASVAVTHARETSAWSTLVALMLGWCAQHNPNSEYESLRNSFPETTLAAGWQIPAGA